MSAFLLKSNVSCLSLCVALGMACHSTVGDYAKAAVPSEEERTGPTNPTRRAAHENQEYTVPQSLNVRAQPINETELSREVYEIDGHRFRRQNVSGVNQDCFFNALGLTRREETRQLGDNLQNPVIRRMIANEILSSLLLDANELPNDIKQAIGYEAYQEERQLLNEHQEKRNRLLQEQNENENQQETAQLSVELQNIPELEHALRENMLERILASEEALRSYVVTSIGRAGHMMVMLNDVQGEEGDAVEGNWSAIDAIAELNNFELRVYQPTTRNLADLSLVHTYRPQGATQVAYLYFRGGHFQVLVPDMGIETSSANEISKETSKNKGAARTVRFRPPTINVDTALLRDDGQAQALRDLFEKRRAVGIAFEGIDFGGRDLFGFTLKGCSFRGCDLRGTQIEKADTYGTSFAGAVLDTPYSSECPNFNMEGHISQVHHMGQLHDLKRVVSYDAIAGLRIRDSLGGGDPFTRLLLAYTLEIHGTEAEEQEAYQLYRALSDLEENEETKAIRSMARNNLAYMLEMNRGNPALDENERFQEAQKIYERNQPLGDQQFFSFVRFFATRRAELDARYRLALSYTRGENISQDLEAAYYWFKSVADDTTSVPSVLEKHKVRAMYRVGVALLNGEGVAPNKEMGAEYIRKAAEHNHERAMTLYGILLERGEGVQRDLRLSAIYCQRAAKEENSKDARRRMGFKYLHGLGVDKDLRLAIKYFKLAVTQQSISANVQVGRISQMLARQLEPGEEKNRVLQESLEAYRAVLVSDPTNIEALYGMGILYTKGEAIARDIELAREYFTKAATWGHPGAVQHLRAIDPEYQRTVHQRAANEKLYDSVRHTENVKIVKGLVKFIDLEEEFARVQEVIRQAEEAQHHLPLRVNFDTICADPYMCQFMVNINEQVSDEEVTPELFDAYFQDIVEAYGASPAFLEGSEKQLTEIRDKLKGGDIHLRKKFLYLYRKWLEGEDMAGPPEGVDDVVRFHQGRIGAKLLQNVGRCNDGMSDYLDDENWQMMSSSGGEIPLYVRLSQVLAQYKLDFINRHKNPLPGYHEEAVEATQLLVQRLRLPLGLPVDFVNLYNPLHGAMYEWLHADRYKPDAVMRRFIEGGVIEFREGNNVVLRHFEPYTPATLVSLLRNALNDSHNRSLTFEHLNLYIMTDESLQGQFDTAFIDFEETPFFDPMGEESEMYKDALLEYLLERFGYLNSIEIEAREAEIDRVEREAQEVREREAELAWEKFEVQEAEQASIQNNAEDLGIPLNIPNKRDELEN